MSRPQTQVATCKSCGHASNAWSARCPSCQSWMSRQPSPDIAGPRIVQVSPAIAIPTALAEQEGDPGQRGRQFIDVGAVSGGKARPVPITEVREENVVRMPTGIEPLDRVLGGGMVPGSVILIGGDAGTGKSTLIAQTIMATAPHGKSLYATAEETVTQVCIRHRRIGAIHRNIHVVMENDVETIIGYARDLDVGILVVDSMQAMICAGAGGNAGSVNQINASAAKFIEFAKLTETIVIMICHILKDDDIAGPKTLQHAVDVVLKLESDEEMNGIKRLSAPNKNRFGSTLGSGEFHMTDAGLEPIERSDGEQGRRATPTHAGDLTPIVHDLMRRLLDAGGAIDRGLRDRLEGRVDMSSFAEASAAP